VRPKLDGAKWSVHLLMDRRVRAMKLNNGRSTEALFLAIRLRGNRVKLLGNDGVRYNRRKDIERLFHRRKASTNRFKVEMFKVGKI
jgi:hypothetical protein